MLCLVNKINAINILKYYKMCKLFGNNLIKTVVADNNDKQAFLNYRLQAGMIASSLEHQTPEQLYNTDPDNPVQGISTMKAFAIANAEGQKIYTVTQDNINDVLPKIQASPLTLNAITNAVNAGKTVTVHEREVSVPGWTGTGYMVIDPVTGDGAYMISGGGMGDGLSSDYYLQHYYYR